MTAAWLDGFAKLPTWAICDHRLSDGARVTLAYIVARIFGESYAVSQSEIARDRGITDRAVRAHTKVLASAGYLAVSAGPNCVAIYRRGPSLSERPSAEVLGTATRTGNEVPHRKRSSAPETTFRTGNDVPDDRKLDSGGCGNEVPPSVDEDQTKQTIYNPGSGEPGPVVPPLRLVPPAKGPTKAVRSDVQAVFEHWCRVFKKPPSTKLLAKRRGVIEKALKDYGLNDVKRCIDGYSQSDWHCGDNPNGKPFTEIELFLRNETKIERGLELAGGLRAPTDPRVAKLRSLDEREHAAILAGDHDAVDRIREERRALQRSASK